MLCCASALAFYGLVAYAFVHVVYWFLEKISIGGNESKPVLVTGCDSGEEFVNLLR